MNRPLLPPIGRIPRVGSARLSSRQRVLAQWRGIDLSAEEKVLRMRAKSSGALVAHVLSSIGIDRRRMDAEIVRVWNQSLAPDIAAHAQPIGLRKSTLLVSVDSSAWLCEILRYRRKEILERLQHSFGSELISKLSFRVS